jgi:uncharacterized damage-inducible protein DinB
MRTLTASIEGEYRRYKALADQTFGQLADADVARRPGEADNSIAVIVWHLAGNLRSRFTDFLTSDGEKPWRDRDSEFLDRQPTRGELIAFWEAGWDVLWDALAGLTDEHLGTTVHIRQQPLSVAEALHRSLAHAAYHVGQITWLGKHLRGDAWHYLSIPPGQSQAYNQNPNREKLPAGR